MLDIAIATSASIRALTGSSRPGAVPPLVSLGAISLGPDTPRAAAPRPDAEVIDLAGRVKALADRHARVQGRMLAIHGRIDRWNFADRPERPDEMHSEMTVVRAALTEPWSSGQAGGQTNRLKLIKRQSYGRADLDLLQRRLVLAA